MKLTLTLEHEKSTRNYEKYSHNGTVMCTLYIPKEEFNGRPISVPRALSVTVQPVESAPRSSDD